MKPHAATATAPQEGPLHEVKEEEKEEKEETERQAIDRVAGEGARKEAEESKEVGRPSAINAPKPSSDDPPPTTLEQIAGTTVPVFSKDESRAVRWLHSLWVEEGIQPKFRGVYPCATGGIYLHYLSCSRRSWHLVGLLLLSLLVKSWRLVVSHSQVSRLVFTGFLVSSFSTFAQFLVGIAMILNHIVNGSVVSVIYPLALFYHLLVAYPRASRNFWFAVLTYNFAVLAVKLAFQLPIFCLEVPPDSGSNTWAYRFSCSEPPNIALANQVSGGAVSASFSSP